MHYWYIHILKKHTSTSLSWSGLVFLEGYKILNQISKRLQFSIGNVEAIFNYQREFDQV